MTGCCHEERSPRVTATQAARCDASSGRSRRKLGRAKRDATRARAPHPVEPKLPRHAARDQQSTEALSIEAKVWPNVEGNRPADEMRTEDQSMCRRVRLTVGLGPSVHDSERIAKDREMAR